MNMSSTAAINVVNSIETLVNEAVESALDDFDFEDKVDLSDYVRESDVMDHIDISQLTDDVRDEIDCASNEEVHDLTKRVQALEAFVNHMRVFFVVAVAELHPEPVTPEEG
jgi:hypothetical protein